MAEEYGVRLKVTADTAEAQAKMDELLKQKAQRVQKAVSPGGGSGGGSTVDPRRNGRELGQAFNKEVSGTTGKMIGKAIAGFVLHQGMSTAFAFARTEGADNTNVNRAQGAASGALQFGTMGFMMGGPAGAAIGAIVGGVSGLAGELAKERQAQQQTRMGMWNTVRAGNENTLSGLGAMAQQRLLDWQGSREERINWLTNNREDLRVRQREAADRLSAFRGDTSSKEYANLQGDFNRLTAQYNNALSAEMTERMSPLYNPYDASEFSDSFSKRGLGVGPMVDVGSANEKIIEQQTKMVDLLQKIVDTSNAGAGMNGANLNTLLHDIIDSTVLR